MPKVQALETTTPGKDVGEWLSLIDSARRDMRDYEERCNKIRKRYTYENSQTVKRRKFQMLWANQEILRPAVYAKRPSPSVTNRWKDGDAVARITCELLERNLDFQFDVCDYDHVFQQVRDDYLLFARGVCRLRYEPTFKTDEIDEGEDDDDAGRIDGGEASSSGGTRRGEEAEESSGGGARVRTGDGGAIGHAGDSDDGEGDQDEDEPPETIKFENVHLDFVQLNDFVHPKCRTWKELPWLVYTSYLDREKLVDRFGEKIGKDIQLDTTDEGPKNDADKRVAKSEAAKKATIYEIWDKSKRKVLWISPGHPDILDSGDPYLKFEGFFPSPRPAYGTLTTDSLVPHPDFIFYQDQAEEIDELTGRIGHLTDCLKLVGFYPGGPSGDGAPEIANAVKPGFENKMIPVKSWAAFTEGGKLGVPIVWLPVEMVGEILKGCVELRKQLIDDIYQLTGISDIIRGTTEAEETAAAQGLKSQWGSLRLNVRQKELARLAKDVTRMAAEVMANHFSMSTLVKCANMKVPTEAENQQQIEEYRLQLRNFQEQQQIQQMRALPPPGSSPSSAPGIAPGAPPGGPAGAQPPAAPSGPPGPPQGPPSQGSVVPFRSPPGPSVSGVPSTPQLGAGSPVGGGGASAPSPQPPPAAKPPPPPQLGPTQEMVAELLADAVTQRFLIDIETDSTVAADENAEKAARTQVLEAISKFVVAWMPIIQASPELLPLAGEMLLFAVRAFPASRPLEEAIEQAMDKMQAASGQPKPPNPEQLKAQADLERTKAEIETAQIKAASSAAEAKADMAGLQLKNQTAIEEHKMKMQQMQFQGQLEAHKLQSEHDIAMQRLQSEHQAGMEKLGMQHQLAQTQMAADYQNASANHALEQSKQMGQQKTLEQTAAMAEQKNVARQSLDQFKLQSQREIQEGELRKAREMSNLGPEGKPREPEEPAKKRNFQILRGNDGRMASISEV